MVLSCFLDMRPLKPAVDDGFCPAVAINPFDVCVDFQWCSCSLWKQSFYTFYSSKSLNEAAGVGRLMDLEMSSKHHYSI